MVQTTEEWWDSLSDTEKFQAYKSMRAANESHANALNAITDHLLGKDWYCMAMDLYGVNEEIVATIKANYPNVNYNWSHTWEKITDAISKSIDAIRDHFKN